MELFSKTVTKKAMQQPGDDVLLLHGMLLMAGADGSIEQAELSTVQAFLDTLPEFSGKRFDDLLAKANRLVATHGDIKASINALGRIESPAIKKKCFVLAADIALSSGDIDATEEALLHSMQQLLGIDDAFAAQVVDVLQAKYAR
jgi:tellurite resistance protein